MADSVVLRQIARFYVEVVRGIPILVLLFYIAFVGAPGFVQARNFLASPLISAGVMDPLLVREVSLMWRAIIALTIGYSAFIAEIFRAGFQSVDPGQIDAAKALGLSRFQRFRLIVMPQALRTILPPLGNDFVAMVKDSSLVSVLGVADITQMGKVYAASSFRFFETYSIVAYIYLLLTVTLSLALRTLDQPLCSFWPWGLHFLWHLLNATVLGLLALDEDRVGDTVGRLDRALRDHGDELHALRPLGALDGLHRRGVVLDGRRLGIVIADILVLDGWGSGGRRRLGGLRLGGQGGKSHGDDDTSCDFLEHSRLSQGAAD